MGWLIRLSLYDSLDEWVGSGHLTPELEPVLLEQLLPEKQDGDSYHRTVITSAPSTLVFTLNRSNGIEKNCDRMSFEHELDLSAYLSDELV